MRWIGCLVAVVCLVNATACRAETPPNNPAVRSDLQEIKLRDGALLRMTVQFRRDQKREELPVTLQLFPSGVSKGEKGPHLWKIPDATEVDFVPGRDRYLALAGETPSTIFVYFLWNNRHITVEKTTGKVVETGDGDDVLRAHLCLMPLKLTAWEPSTTRKRVTMSSKNSDNLFAFPDEE